MRIFASLDLARPICSKILGPTKDMMPASRMKTMTISRIVKPRWRREGIRVISLPRDLERQVVNGHHRHEDRDDNEADDDRHRNDHHRLQQGEGLADRD